MRLWIVVALVAGLGGIGGCTKHNPRACSDGMCSDPTYPYCDVEGNLGGLENECIAVTCTPNEFTECRSNTEIRCNAAGDNYDLTQCERVCDATHDGCRLCNASESACTNSTFATCDANGTLIATTPCKLGCFDSTRCKEITASNGLSAYRDMVAHPPDMDLSGGANIDTLTGTIDGYPFTIPSFLIPAPAGGAAIRVFIANRVRLGNITFNPSPSNLGDERPALAIVATDEITVEGTLGLSGASYVVPGSVSFLECSGTAGQDGMVGNQRVTAGGGGGGHASVGAHGGQITLNGSSMAAAGLGGGVSGTLNLVPLRGGCPGADYTRRGGGAVQLTSNAAIRVTGTIDVRGGASKGITGGGAGGGILLEAPIVEVSASGRLLATGGSGGSAQNDGSQSPDSSAAPGAPCTMSGCGAGGDGAAVGIPATPGADVAMNQSDLVFTGGGGGGGVGRIRINTFDGTRPRRRASKPET